MNNQIIKNNKNRIIAKYWIDRTENKIIIY